MTENDFFIEILKQTPDNSIIKTTGMIEYFEAEQLEILVLKDFVPSKVDFNFELTSKNREQLISFIKSKNCNDLITHYHIYRNGDEIGHGFDSFSYNIFDIRYFKNKFENFKKVFEIDNADIIKQDKKNNNQKTIKILEVKQIGQIYALEIFMKIKDSNLKLRFLIEKEDYDILFSLLKATKFRFEIETSGNYYRGKTSTECVFNLKDKKSNIEIGIPISDKFIANINWFLKLETETEIETMKI